MNGEHDRPPGAALARYPELRDTTVQIANAPSGYVTRAWRIDTETGSFLLRRHPADTVAENAATTAEVHALAAQAGLAPTLVANDTGGLITGSGGRLFTLSAYLESSTSGRGVPGLTLCHRLGHALGRLHQQLRHASAGGLHHWRLPGTAALRAALHAHDRSGCRHPATRRVLQVKLARAQAIPVTVRTRLNDLDRQVIHGDVHPANILLTGTRPVFVDFDLARFAPPAYELMRALIYCTHPAGPPEAYRYRVTAFLHGYLAARPLTEHQIATMVELYWTVQILDPYGLHACENVQETLLGFGHARFALLYWLNCHATGLTAHAHQIRHPTE
jgi:Ser/Thr protein kinase RdoA (MazF antagonist)